MTYRIYCKCCGKEISWHSIPFFSTEFCNPECRDKRFEVIREQHNAIERQRVAQRIKDQDRNYKPKPPKNSPQYPKWAKIKHLCEHCKCKYTNAEGYSVRFCSLVCRNDNNKRQNVAYQDAKRETRINSFGQTLCAGCEKAFVRTSNAQKFCSVICREKQPIKKSNKIWLNRDLDELKKKQSARNRRLGTILSSDHVREKIWTGKKFKAVRG